MDGGAPTLRRAPALAPEGDETPELTLTSCYTPVRPAREGGVGNHRDRALGHARPGQTEPHTLTIKSNCEASMPTQSNSWVSCGTGCRVRLAHRDVQVLRRRGRRQRLTALEAPISQASLPEPGSGNSVPRNPEPPYANRSISRVLRPPLGRLPLPPSGGHHRRAWGSPQHTENDRRARGPT